MIPSLRSLFVIVLLGSTIFCRAQQMIETNPILATAFPMEEKDNRVTLPYSILLNKVILPKGSTLRVLYVMPQMGDNEVRNEIVKKQQERVFSRAPEKIGKDESPLVLAAKKIALETRWPTAQLFKLKLANQNTPDLKLVFQETPEAMIQEVPINFLHGLFLAEKAGQITLLAVERQSPADYGKFVAGDILVQLGSQKLDGTLAQFLKCYAEEKPKAEATPSRELQFQIQTPGNPTPIVKSIKLALSLKGNLLDY